MSDIEDVNACVNDIHEEVHELNQKYQSLVARLDQLVASHNQVGENIAWLTANTQGIFAMLNSPDMMNQMMGVLGGGAFGGRRQAGPAEDGPGE